MKCNWQKKPSIHPAVSAAAAAGYLTVSAAIAAPFPFPPIGIGSVSGCGRIVFPPSALAIADAALDLAVITATERAAKSRRGAIRGLGGVTARTAV